jgi:hypothetical protein
MIFGRKGFFIGLGLNTYFWPQHLIFFCEGLHGTSKRFKLALSLDSELEGAHSVLQKSKNQRYENSIINNTYLLSFLTSLD